MRAFAGGYGFALLDVPKAYLSGYRLRKNTYPGKVRGTADPSTARRDRSASLLLTTDRVARRVPWYPTSREKRARCGAPELLLPVQEAGHSSPDSLQLVGCSG